MIAQEIEKLKQAIGDREFVSKDIVTVLKLPNIRATGSRFKYMLHRNIITKTNDGYRFVAMPEAPIVAEENVPNSASEPACILPSLVRIGELYLHERMLLIADMAHQDQSDAVRIYTTIIEVDPATKHPRNKIINFIKSRDPHEYAQILAWLHSLAGVLPMAVDETALELAAETERKLIDANKDIVALKAKIEAIRGMIRGEL